MVDVDLQIVGFLLGGRVFCAADIDVGLIPRRDFGCSVEGLHRETPGGGHRKAVMKIAVIAAHSAEIVDHATRLAGDGEQERGPKGSLQEHTYPRWDSIREDVSVCSGSFRADFRG